MKNMVFAALCSSLFIIGAGAGSSYAAQAPAPSKAPAETIDAATLSNKWDKTFPENAKVAHQKITFHNRYGITLVGDLYTPTNMKQGEKLAAIAVAGPYGAVKEQVSGRYAQELAGFWSVNVGLRADFGAALAKDMFSMMRTMNGFALEDVAGTNQSYSLSNQTLNMKAYAEVGLGYSRRITEKLTVGGRVKVLLGLARAEMNINQFDLNLDVPNPQYTNYADYESRGELSPSDWYGAHYDYSANGNVITTLKGGGMTFDNNGMIDNFDLDAGDLGIAGSGFGIDLGASYKVWDNLTVSASILDLGFLKWKESETTVATVSGGDEVPINSENYDRYIGGDFLSFERFDFEEGSPEKVKTKTRLYSTLLLAGEYGLLNNKLSVGAMYTARFAEPKTLNELTFLATFRPKNWLNAAISYSPIQASGKSIGLAVKLGPLFVGTDYMFFGGNSKSVNGFLGISFPLGGKPKPFSEL